MKIVNRLKAHLWLFIGLSATPVCIICILAVCLYTFGNHVNKVPYAIPEWTGWLAFISLLACESITGFVLAYCLSVFLEKLNWLATRRLTRIYLILFALIWNVVFGYLSFFAFAMGLGDGPAATSLEEFMRRFMNVLCFGFPEVTLISLLVCFVVTAIIIAISESMFFAWIK